MAANDLTLWGIGTPRTMRAHWMLAELGLEYAMRPIGSRSGETRTAEFLALNPRHKIPVLRHGDFVLAESMAIITYLAETFDAPDGFFVPQEPVRRAKLNEWCSFILMELDALALYVIRRHFDLADEYGAAPNVVASAKDYFIDQAGARFGNEDFDREFLMPEGMSVADILLTTVLESARRREIAIPASLEHYYRRMIARPAYRDAFARNWPDRRIDPSS